MADNPFVESPPDRDAVDTADNDETSAYTAESTVLKSKRELDTCRICRGAGTLEEPLFHPCKCSGSIKWVHQSCLVEWLSHSRKKHCELCKTPFRFTKLYHPRMPKSVPTPVFLRQAAQHLFKNAILWLRCALVIFVWVMWLPWCTRTTWRSLFWLADGSWVWWTMQNNGGAQWLSGESTSSNNLTSLAGPFKNVLDLKNATASAILAHLSRKVTSTMERHSSGFESISLTIFGQVYTLFSRTTGSATSTAQSASSTSVVKFPLPRSSSWLSDVRTLTELTSSTTFNNIIIDTLEGIIITLFVVIGFVLLFLIREWVMQNEHNLLLGPDGNVQEPAGPNIEAVAAPEVAFEGPAPEQPIVEEGEDVDAGDRQADHDRRRPRRLFAWRQRRARPGLGRQNTADAAVEQVPAPVEVDESPPEETNPSPASDSSPSQANIGPNVAPDVGLQQQDGDIQDSATTREVRGDEEHHAPSPSASSPFNNESRIPSVPPASEPGGHPSKDDQIMVTDSAGNAQVPPPADSDNARAGHDPNDHASISRTLQEDTSQSANKSPLQPREFLAASLEPERDFPDIGSPLMPLVDAREPAQITQDSASDRDTTAQEDSSPSHNEDTDATYVPAPGPQANDIINEQARPDVPLVTRDEYSPVFVSEPASQNQVEDAGFVEYIKNLLWGGVANSETGAWQEDQVIDEEHVVNDIGEEAPFVAVARGQPIVGEAVLDDAAPEEQDADVVAAAMQAGIDPNGAAADDMEDLEGVLELIGMEGPLAGLVQNAMFFVVLVSLTMLFGLWVPFVFGKLFLIILGDPVAVSLGTLRLVSTSVDLLTDGAIFTFSCALFWVDVAVNTISSPIGHFLPSIARFMDNSAVSEAAKGYAEAALGRLARNALLNGGTLTQSLDVPTLSALAHESLLSFKSSTWAVLTTCFQGVSNALGRFSSEPRLLSGILQLIADGATRAKDMTAFLVERSWILDPWLWDLSQIDPLKINLVIPQRSTPLDYTLASWNGVDKAIAILAGYAFFVTLGMLYLRLCASIQGVNKKGLVEGPFPAVLYQAGGVAKVILIIGIEVLLFPLYSGILLDLTMLPLFERATVMSRLNFTMRSPWTSLFIHWFLGTCYMFHIALFLTMARKILRKGVLFHIRDSDDPNLHPIGDVLERPVSTQLWKLIQGAFLCGIMIMAGLGIIRMLAHLSTDLFPVHWSSNQPILEFPVDLLFYNFLMPTTVKLFKPSKGIRKLYGWWFRKCARALRLSHFLMKDEREDEQGHHVRLTWRDVLRGEKGDVSHPVIGNDRCVLAQDRNMRAFFLRDGQYVRAPASESVRLPPGYPALVPVDADNNRTDGIEDKDDGLHGRLSSDFEKVYIPPRFRLRMACFALLVWLFTAAIGVSVTIAPLILGRWLFSWLVPGNLRTNDIYAFSIGIYVLGSLGWVVINHRRVQDYLYKTITPHNQTIRTLLSKVSQISVRVLKIVYTYGTFGIIFPFLFSLLLEFYVIIPLQTYIARGLSTTVPPTNIEVLSSPSSAVSSSTSTSSTLLSTDLITPFGWDNSVVTLSPPIIHLVQDWTLGILYVKLLARLILYTQPSRAARALRAIVRTGWLDPDARLATRAFILPVFVLVAVFLTFPLAAAWLANHTWLASWVAVDDGSSPAALAAVVTSAAKTVTTSAVTVSNGSGVYSYTSPPPNSGLHINNSTLTYRYSYPILAALLCVSLACWAIGRVLKGWRRRVRDEVYLIGERLHNFGDGGRRSRAGRDGGNGAAGKRVAVGDAA